MELADTPAKTTNPRHRRLKRVLVGSLVTVVLIGSLFAVMLSTRSPWHLVTGTGKPGEWVASVECPDNWQIEDEQNKQSYTGITALTVRRKPLTGIWAWWNQYVLHHPQNDSNTELRFFVVPEPRFIIDGKFPAPISHADHISKAEALLDAWEFGYKAAGQSGAGFKITSKRISHPLGPALEFSMDDMRIGNQGKGTFGAAVGYHYTTLNIAPTEAGDFSGSVMVSYTNLEPSSPLKTVMERMARSVRLIKK